ncbi:MAG: ABC transporter substrate-binding protein [Chloroflexota bacterium]
MKFRITSILTLLALLIVSIAPLSAQDNDAFPVSIDHKFGTTTIEAEPQRIVVLGYTEQDPYLALGAEPVAIRYWYGDESAIFPWAEEAAEGIDPEVLNMGFGTLNYEAILALEPDLISAVDAGITAEEYEALSQIAPTLAQYDTYVDFGMPWQETTRLIGTAIGQAEEADALVTDIEERIESIREENPQFEGQTVAVSYFFGGNYGYYTGQDSRGRFFTDLGFVVPEELNEIAGESFFADISEERLDLIDQDLLVFLALQFFEDGSEAAREAIESNPIVAQLNAVQDERTLFVADEFDDALQFSTVLSLNFLLDGLVPEIVEIFPAEDDMDMEATEEASCAAGLRTVVDAIGSTVCLPEQPTRVISLTDGDTDALVALGIDPVGVSNGRGSQTPPNYLIDFLPDDFVSVGGFFQPNLEIVLELEPDLILFSYGDFADPELLEQLNAIAPVYVPVSGNGTWQDLFTSVGTAMNMDAEVETFLADYESRITTISEEVDADTQFVIARWAAEGPQVMASYVFAPAILQELGMVMPEEIPELQEGHAHSAPLSLETIEILDADWLFAGTLQATGDAADALADVFDNPLFQQLQVVQNEQVVVVDGSIWTSSGGPLAANLVLDVIEANLLGS